MNSMTTISISQSLKEKIKEFGSKGESYDSILQRWYQYAEEKQLENLLFDTKDSTPIEEALNNSRKKWSQSNSFIPQI